MSEEAHGSVWITRSFSVEAISRILDFKFEAPNQIEGIV